MFPGHFHTHLFVSKHSCFFSKHRWCYQNWSLHSMLKWIRKMSIWSTKLIFYVKKYSNSYRYFILSVLYTTDKTFCRWIYYVKVHMTPKQLIKLIDGYFVTSRFWPRVRAPVFLSSLPLQPGRCAPPPRPSQPPKLNKIYKTRAARVKSFPEINCFPSGSNLSRPRHGLFSFHWTTESLKYEVPLQPIPPIV